jgi:hypothetical protein
MSAQQHIIPNHAVTFVDLDHLNPDDSALVTSRCDQPLRVIGARVVAEFPLSRVARLLRQIPGVRRLLRDRDASRRGLATKQVRLYHVAVGNYASAPDKCDELPIASAGDGISVCVINTGEEPVIVRIVVEGVLI